MSGVVTVALSGNPNAGKTTLFNALTGARQHVGNWPGVTVEKKEGSLIHDGREIHVVDLPGTYSLTAYSLEEIVARNFIVDSLPDVVVDVVDASNLERNLYLAAQLLEMGVKLVIALNMIDVAEGRRIKIDVAGLSNLLGVPVVATNGKKGLGIDALMDEAVKLADSAPKPTRKLISYGVEVEDRLDRIEKLLEGNGFPKTGLSTKWLALKLLEGDPEITKKFDGFDNKDALLTEIDRSRVRLTEVYDDRPEILLADARYGFISGAVRQTVSTEAGDRVHLSETLDRCLTNRFFGPLILMAVLYSVYVFTFQGSEVFVKWFELFFTKLGAFASEILPDGLLKSLIVSGVINGVGGVLGFTPLIAFMFLAIAFLEDTGYMARIAFMLDRLLRGFGLHGSSILALMISGGLAGGCAVPGIMATRTMKEPKERLTTILIAPLMNCGAKLPVYALLISAFFTSSQAQIMFLLTFVSWALALLTAKVIRMTALSGPSAPFVLELPPYRIPTLKGLLLHTWERTWMYIKKAGTVILAVSVVLWAMMQFPGLPEERDREYTTQSDKVTSEFLGSSAVLPFFKTHEDIEAFEKYKELRTEKPNEPAPAGHPGFDKLSDALKEGARSTSQDVTEVVAQYTDYKESVKRIEGEKQTERLKSSLGGRMGVALEYVLGPLGFDWRVNVALVGGFAAKEVVVATLGTAYSLSDVNPEESQSLQDRLRAEPGWNPLVAVTLILFVMLYNPCFTTLVVIRRESGQWRWMFFAMAYTTALAYAVALTAKTLGTLLHLGV